MKAKRILLVLLALAMVVTCFAGCKKNQSTGTASSITYADGKDGSESVYPIKCDDTLDYWMNADSGMTAKYMNFGETPLGKALEEKTGVKVTYIHPPAADSQTQLHTMMTTGSLPALVQTNWSAHEGGPQAAIDQGIINSLTDAINNYAPNFKKVVESNPYWEKSVKTDNGDYYVFPFLLEPGILQVCYGAVWRTDWLDEAGLEIPETIDEWETALTAFKDKFGATKPFTGNQSSIQYIGSAFDAYYDFYVDNGKVKYGPAEPEYKDMLAKLHDWYQKGLLDSEIFVGEGTETKMTTGQSGVAFGYAGSSLGKFMTSTAKTDPSIKYGGSKFPVINKGDVPELTFLADIINPAIAVAITTNCKNVELATRWLDYGYSEEGHMLYNFGIEGESYNMVDGYPKYTDLVLNNPDGFSPSQALGFYTRASYSGPIVQDTRYIEQYYQTEEQKEAQKLWGVTNMADHIMPTVYLSDENSDEYADIMVGVKDYVKESVSHFIKGDTPISEFDNYIAELNKMGLDKAVQYKQEAYDRFLTR